MTNQQAKVKAIRHICDGRRKAQQALHRIVKKEVGHWDAIEPGWPDHGWSKTSELACNAVLAKARSAGILSALYYKLTRNRIIKLMLDAHWGQI
jgi:hypothetical protein